MNALVVFCFVLGVVEREGKSSQHILNIFKIDSEL